MSQELVLVRNCDICQKDQKVKTQENVDSLTVTINGYTREIDLCPSHRDVDVFPISFDELRDVLAKYGRKPLADEPVPAKSEKDRSTSPYMCKCGRAFTSVRRLNMHIGQQRRTKSPAMHTRIDTPKVVKGSETCRATGVRQNQKGKETQQ